MAERLLDNLWVDGRDGFGAPAELTKNKKGDGPNGAIALELSQTLS